MTTLAQGRGRGRATRRVPARTGRTAAGGGDFAASDLHEGGEARLGCEACERSAVWPHRSSATRREAGQQGGVGPSGAGAGASLHREGGGGKVTPAREPTPGGRQAQHSACACGGDLPRRVGLPGWREGMRHTLPCNLSTPIPPAAPTARLDPFGSRRAPAAENLSLAPAAK